jgi:hypothetical protein
MDKDHECYKIYFKLSKLKQEIPDNIREGANRHRKVKHAANPEARRQRDMERYYKNHEESLKKAAEQRNTEVRQEYMKEFRKSENGLRANKISKWKYMGVKCDDFDELYKLFKETKVCADCDVELVEGNKGRNRKCLDHDHATGLFRDVVCHGCNQIRGVTDRMAQL